MTRLLCPALCVIAVLASACGPGSRPMPGVPDVPDVPDVADVRDVPASARAPGAARDPEAAHAPESGRTAASRALPPVPIRDVTPEDIATELWPETRVSFVPMSAGDRERLAALVAGLTAAARSGGDVRALAVRAPEIGFRVEIWRVRGRVFWALLEAPAQRRGAGAYLIRPGPHLTGQPEIVLQAPHVFFDLRTGHIAAALFFGWEGRGRARALFTNTVYRYAGVEDRASGAPASPALAPTMDAPTAPATAPVTAPAAAPATAPTADPAIEPAIDSALDPAIDPEEPRGHAPADVAHAAEHAFQAATEAVVRELDQVVVIQLHGFAERPARPQIILSSGADEIGALLPALAAGLSTVFERVLRYPEEAAELGGTRNVQGRMLALHPRAHFVHVELSARTRARLATTPALLARFAHALLSLGAR